MPSLAPNAFRSASFPRERQAAPTPQKRYAMNPNRMLIDVLSGFEGQLYKAQVKIEMRQSQSGVLNVGKDCAESVLKVLLGRIVTIAGPGSTLRFHWSRNFEGLRLELSLNPPAAQRADRTPLPLLPQTSPLRQRLKDSGIRYESDNSSGPWALTFDAIDL